MTPDPITQLTRAFLEAEGFDPDLEIQHKETSGVHETYRTLAEIAVETLGLEQADIRLCSSCKQPATFEIAGIVKPCGHRGWLWQVNREPLYRLSRFEGDG